ncbi:MAG: MmcB family DNA repair protein [Prevotella sp.]|nr:MmcB family DNA repair protein [Prevotella sp.]
MKERQKIIEDWEKRWNSWEPTGIKCPKCGGELRLNREGIGSGTTDDWCGSREFDVWVPYDRTYRQAIWDPASKSWKHCEYVCKMGHCYDAERYNIAIDPDELRRIFSGQGSAHLMLDHFGLVPYWGVLRLSDKNNMLELVRPSHRANITGSRYLNFMHDKWGNDSLPRLSRSQFERYIVGSDVSGTWEDDSGNKVEWKAKKMEEKQQPQTRTLKQIETELTESVRQDNVTWQRCYELMNAVDTGRLYEEEGLKNFTAWMNSMADSIGCHVSLLWSRLKAGRTYSEYAKRARAAGREVPELAEAPLSPDTLKLCSTVAGSDGAALDNLIDKSLSGALSRTDLRVAAKAKRARAPESVSTRHSVAADIAARDGDTAPTPALTAAEIVLALQTSRDWVGTPDETKYIERKYHVFTEFRADTGSSRAARRFDVLAVETLTLSERDAVRLHGVEIKVSKEDLLGDHKMQEYGDFCDAFYIAVPDVPEMVEAAESIKLTAWGILAVSSDGELRVVHQAEERLGVMRDKTLAAVIIKLI